MDKYQRPPYKETSGKQEERKAKKWLEKIRCQGSWKKLELTKMNGS
jgi:hypothetical protein